MNGSSDTHYYNDMCTYSDTGNHHLCFLVIIVQEFRKLDAEFNTQKILHLKDNWLTHSHMSYVRMGKPVQYTQEFYVFKLKVITEKCLNHHQVQQEDPMRCKTWTHRKILNKYWQENNKQSYPTTCINSMETKIIKFPLS